MAKSKTANRRSGASTDTELLKIADDFKRQAAQITMDTVAEMEATELNDRAIRRLASASLTKSGAELVEAFQSKRSTALAAAQTINSVEAYASRLRSLAELMDAARMRLGLAMCFRDDMHSLIAEAESVQSGQEVAHA